MQKRLWSGMKRDRSPPRAECKRKDHLKKCFCVQLAGVLFDIIVCPILWACFATGTWVPAVWQSFKPYSAAWLLPQRVGSGQVTTACLESMVPVECWEWSVHRRGVLERHFWEGKELGWGGVRRGGPTAMAHTGS